MPRFFVQEHAARHRHWDLRLEAGGVLKSWALPKGPSMEPGARRLALRMPDHPIGCGPFEGRIPEGRYGAGLVRVWDRGKYALAEEGGTVESGLERGRISLVLHGYRLKGSFALVRIANPRRGDAWLLVKRRDASALPGWTIPTLLGSG